MVFRHRFPNLRLLDFRKIKKAHRKEALELFKSKRGKDILKEIAKKTKLNGAAFAANGSADAQQQKRKLIQQSGFQRRSYVGLVFRLQFLIKRRWTCSKSATPSRMPQRCRRWNV